MDADVGFFYNLSRDLSIYGSHGWLSDANVLNTFYL